MDVEFVQIKQSLRFQNFIASVALVNIFELVLFPVVLEIISAVGFERALLALEFIVMILFDVVSEMFVVVEP